MEESKGKIIYEFLKKLNATEKLPYGALDDIKSDADNDSEILDYLKDNDLIESKNGRYAYDCYVYIRPNGRDVLKYDSWTDYINAKTEQKNSAILKENEREDKKDEKLNLDISLGKFEKKQGTKFKQFGFIIIVINLIVVIAGLFISSRANDQSKSQEYHRQERTERNMQRLENQILILEKKIDSTSHLSDLKKD